MSLHFSCLLERDRVNYKDFDVPKLVTGVPENVPDPRISFNRALENLGTSAVILGYLFGMVLLFLWAWFWLKEKGDIDGVSRV